MSNFANSKGFHRLCVAIMWGANSRSVTFSIIVLCCVLYIAANRLLDGDGILLAMIQLVLQVCIGVRGAILCIPQLRRDVCQKMCWHIKGSES